MDRQPITWHELVTRAESGTLTNADGNALVAEVERLARERFGWLDEHTFRNGSQKDEERR